MQHCAAFCQLSHARMACNAPLPLTRRPFYPVLRSVFAAAPRVTAVRSAAGFRRRGWTVPSIPAGGGSAGRSISGPGRRFSRLTDRVRKTMIRGAGTVARQNLSTGVSGEGRQMTIFFPVLTLCAGRCPAVVRLSAVAGMGR